MPNYIQTDPNHEVVPNLIVGREQSSGDIAKWEAMQNTFCDPPGFTMEPGRYKWNGSAMVPLTQQENDDLTAFDNANFLAGLRNGQKAQLQSGQVLRHLLMAIVDELYVELESMGCPTRSKCKFVRDIVDNAIDRIDE